MDVSSQQEHVLEWLNTDRQSGRTGRTGKAVEESESALITSKAVVNKQQDFAYISTTTV